MFRLRVGAEDAFVCFARGGDHGVLHDTGALVHGGREADGAFELIERDFAQREAAWSHALERKVRACVIGDVRCSLWERPGLRFEWRLKKQGQATGGEQKRSNTTAGTDLHALVPGISSACGKSV